MVVVCESELIPLYICLVRRAKIKVRYYLWRGINRTYMLQELHIYLPHQTQGIWTSVQTASPSRVLVYISRLMEVSCNKMKRPPAQVQ